MPHFCLLNLRIKEFLFCRIKETKLGDNYYPNYLYQKPDLGLIEQALTHPSAVYEHLPGQKNT